MLKMATQSLQWKQNLDNFWACLLTSFFLVYVLSARLFCKKPQVAGDKTPSSLEDLFQDLDGQGAEDSHAVYPGAEETYFF